MEMKETKNGMEMNNGSETVVGTSIEITGAYKSYGGSTSPNVLNNFCMTVEPNSIYALLGASGCGKTTLLNCIVNRLQLDSGTIKLNISTKRLLGFMPQQLALYQEFSIQEVFQYFGILYSMPQKDIDIKLEDLTRLLGLPDRNNLCRSLSGGQQRRISVAITLMHSPKLLILDEPTAGVDPLISESIWTHLLKLSATGVTTIITTHYIDEAKHAHKVGLMRNGVILEEDSPSNLLSKYKTESLEEVFLILSQQQQKHKCINENNNDVEASNSIERKKKQKSVQPTSKQKPNRLYLDDKNVVSTNHLKCQMFKYFNWMKRNIVIALFIILLPGVSVELFNLAFQKLPQLSLAVFNEDSNCTFDPNVERMSCDSNTRGLSCHYLKVIGSDRSRQLNLLNYDDYDLARSHLDKNKVHGVIRIPKNFTEGLVSKLNEGRFVTDDLLNSSFILTDMNRADFIRSAQMEEGLLRGFQSFYKQFILDCGLHEKLSYIPPINFEAPIYGSRKPEFVQFISAGLIVQISFCFPVLFSVSSLVAEKMLGLMERSLIAGLTILEVVLAHSVMGLIMVVTQSTVSMVSQYWLWAHPFHGSIMLAFSLLVLEGICGTLFGFLVALNVSKFVHGAIVVGTLNSTVLIFCGYLWPFEAMHPYAKPLSFLLPPTTGIQALRAIVWKNFSIYDREVFLGFFPPLVWIVLFIINLAYITKRHQI